MIQKKTKETGRKAGKEKKMKTMYFENFDEFEACENKQDEELLAVVKRNDGLCADLFTKTKSWKVALNRFFRELRKAGFYRLAEWEELVKESCKDGVFADKGINPYSGGWFYEVENYDDYWYIALKA